MNGVGEEARELMDSGKRAKTGARWFSKARASSSLDVTRREWNDLGVLREMPVRAEIAGVRSFWGRKSMDHKSWNTPHSCKF